ncbi:hypothetical protein CBR_g52567 [Chara braunii]|uniref:DUF659 domain-containing protein n=1 Tax=Chara braunii TaxID=69332 RepID=A0A388MAK9_CHABU|nr:hypothetical protein CBR_g52567 [Chara braunii]|eukprot:GBG91533.1 hypothetical protein CBR_g52567 [Chara braunii]
MHGDRKLRCNLCRHVLQGNQCKVARHFVQLKKCPVALFDVLVNIWNGTDYKFVDQHHRSIRMCMEEHDIRDSRAVAGGARSRAPPSTAPRDEVQDVLDEMEEREGVELPGEEVVMTSRGAESVRRQGKRPMGEADQVATRPGKRVRQSKIDKVYDADKQSIFVDKFLQWVYDSGASGALLYATICRDGSVPETDAIVFRRWRTIIESFLAKDVTAFCTDSASNYTAAARLLAAYPDPVVRRITWIPCSTHVCNLMLSDIGTRVGWATGTIIRARAMVQFIKSHGAALALYKRKSPRVSLVQPVETRFASVFMMLTCLVGRCDLLEGMLHDDAWASILWERRLLPQARWVGVEIHDGEFWRLVEFAIHVMEPIHQPLRRMDRGGMMMSIVYEWSRHLIQLLRKMDDVPVDLLTPCVREVEMRLMHLLEPAHAATHLLNPHRRSLRYYESLHTTPEDAEVVQECDRFLLAQTGGDLTDRDYLIVRDQMCRFHARRGDWGDWLVSDAEAEDCHGDQETHHCAAWWFAHGTGHPELRAIAIRVMHMCTSAVPEERNCAAHERIQTTNWSRLGFTKLAQLVEIMTNLKLASCRQQGGGRAIGVDSSGDDEAVDDDHLWDRRFDLSHHSREQSQQLRRSKRLEKCSGSASQLPRDIPFVERTTSHGGPAQAATSDLRTNNFDIAGSHGGSPVLRCRVGDKVEYRTDVREREETVEERDARLDHEEEALLQSMPRWEGKEAYEVEQRRQRELETTGAHAKLVNERDARLDHEEEARLQSQPRWDGREEYEAEQRRERELETTGAPGGAGIPSSVRPVPTMAPGGTDSRADSSDDGEDCEPALNIVHNVVVGLCGAGTDGRIHGGEEDIVDEGSVPLEDDAAQVEEGAGVHAGHSCMSDADRQGSSPRGARIDMSLAMIVRTPSVRDGGHVDSGRPVSFSAGGYSGEMPQWDGGESGDCTPTNLHPEQLERLGMEDPFPYTGGLTLPPAWAPMSPRWTGSSPSNIRERESLDSQAAVFSGGVANSQMQPPQRSLSPALYQGPALATGLPPTGGQGSGRGSSSSHRGGGFGGWSSCRREIDRLRRDYDRGQGLLARGPSEEGVPAVGASEAGRPSVHTAAHILRLDRVGTRRTKRVEVYPARSAIQDGKDSRTHRARMICICHRGRDVMSRSMILRRRLLISSNSWRSSFESVRGGRRRHMPRRRTRRRSPSKQLRAERDIGEQRPRQAHTRHTLNP